jgi:hypothetical protein
MADRKRTAATPVGNVRDPRPAPPAEPRQHHVSTTPQEDEASDSVPASEPPHTPYEDMKLPHEQDESAVGEAREGHDPARTRRPMEQAHRDLVSGQEDTDCYDAVAPRFEPEKPGQAPASGTTKPRRGGP